MLVWQSWLWGLKLAIASLEKFKELLAGYHKRDKIADFISRCEYIIQNDAQSGPILLKTKRWVSSYHTTKGSRSNRLGSWNGISTGQCIRVLCIINTEYYCDIFSNYRPLLMLFFKYCNVQIVIFLLNLRLDRTVKLEVHWYHFYFILYKIVGGDVFFSFSYKVLQISGPSTM